MHQHATKHAASGCPATSRSGHGVRPWTCSVAMIGAAIVVLCGSATSTLPADGSNPEGDRCAKAVAEFELKIGSMRTRMVSGGANREEFERDYQRLLESEVERLTPFMPTVLKTISDRLTYRSDRDRRIEELMKARHTSLDEAKELLRLLQNTTDRATVPRCDLAFAMGILGRQTPPEAVTLLVAAIPLPEESEGLCAIRAMMEIGPGAYEPLVDSISREGNLDRVRSVAMALVEQGTKTTFPAESGLGPTEEWDKSFPHSLRSLRKLAMKWIEWWGAHRDDYVWDPSSCLLEAK